MSEAILSTALRPKGLSQLVGQRTMLDALRKQMATRPPQSFLLSGASGTGKTSLARILAMSFQCEHQQQWGDPCNACWAKEPNLEQGTWSYFSVHEINSAETGGVEELEKIVELSRFRPTVGQRRVIILDEAHKLSQASVNLLLKPLEGPPSTTTWIIATTDPQKLLVTMRRRCVTYQLKGLGYKGTELLLQRASKHLGVQVDLAPLISQLEQQQVSSSALVLMAMEKYASGFSAEDSVAATEGTSANSLAICQAVIAGKGGALRTLLQQMTAEESRFVRASTLGYLRGCFWREKIPAKVSLIGECMKELSDGRAPLEDSLLHSWVVATLYNITRKLAAKQ